MPKTHEIAIYPTVASPATASLALATRTRTSMNAKNPITRETVPTSRDRLCRPEASSPAMIIAPIIRNNFVLFSVDVNGRLSSADSYVAQISGFGMAMSFAMMWSHTDLMNFSQ